MKKTISILFFIIFSFLIKGQSLPDKIIVARNTYQYQGYDIEDETIFKSDTVVLTNQDVILGLYSELMKFDDEKMIFSVFGIDTNYIINNPYELLKSYCGRFKNYIDFNEKQKLFISNQLKDFGLLKTELNEYLSKNSSYTMNSYQRFEYVIILLNKDEIGSVFTSRKSVSGFHFPYIDDLKRTTYNFNIDKKLNALFNQPTIPKEPLKGNSLLNYLVNEIVDKNYQELYKLSAFSFQKEISELSTDFNIISSEELSGYGRYMRDSDRTMKITLHNEYMLPNVYIQLLIDRYGDTLYSRDSIKNDYIEIVTRIQAIPFITNYLQQDSNAKLDIYYLNNSGINKEEIDKINKDPVKWAEHDKYVESLKWYENKNIKPSFDLDEAIKSSEINDCGCNYRFDSLFLKEAIFIEIISNNHYETIWFLLPDNTMLLYHVESYLDDVPILKYLKLKKSKKDIDLPFACLRFDKNGNLIKKPTFQPSTDTKNKKSE